MFKAKIFLEYNSKAPSENKYGWLKLPSKLKMQAPVTLEERVGLYGGRYAGSIGAPKYHGLCSIGSFSYCYSALPEGMVIGRYCSISGGLIILDSHHPVELLTTSAISFRPRNRLWKDLGPSEENLPVESWNIYGGKSFPVIGNDVWIGRDVVLSMGIKIGDGAIVAANSVVTKDVPPYAIVAGNPATVKKFRFEEEVVERLLRSRWWEKSPVLIKKISKTGIQNALDELEKAGQSMADYQPRTFTLGPTGISFT